MTLVDLSEGMLEVSRRLNPECDHVRGDMRTIRLGRAVRRGLRARRRRLHDHRGRPARWRWRRPSRTAARAASRCSSRTTSRTTSEEESGHGGQDAADGRGVRYLDWTWDPDPSDTCIRTDYAFVLRDADGEVRVVHESHLTGPVRARPLARPARRGRLRAASRSARRPARTALRGRSSSVAARSAPEARPGDAQPSLAGRAIGARAREQHPPESDDQGEHDDADERPPSKARRGRRSRAGRAHVIAIPRAARPPSVRWCDTWTMSPFTPRWKRSRWRAVGAMKQDGRQRGGEEGDEVDVLLEAGRLRRSGR